MPASLITLPGMPPARPALLRIALIGTGRAAKARARELLLRDDVELSVIASQELARAQELGRAFGAQPMDDPLAAVQRDDIDAVIISTRNERHAPLARAALAAGKHVAVDYPLALSWAEGAELIERAAAVERVLHCEHIELLSPWFRTVSHRMQKLGQLQSLAWTDLSARAATPGDWTFDTVSGFSLFAGASVLSRLVHLAGPAAWVSAHEVLTGLDTGGRFTGRLTQALVGFQNGATAHIQDGTGLPVAGPGSQLLVMGTEGMVLAENRSRVLWRHREGEEELPVMPSDSLFGQDTAAFLAQIRRSGPSYAPLTHVWDWMKLADAAEQSVQSGQRITVS